MGLGTLTAGLGTLVPGLGVHASTLGVLTAGLQGGGALALPTSQWRYYASGGMYMSGSSAAPNYSYQQRITNLDSETITHLALEFASIYSGAAPILGCAISIGGSGSSPGPGGWIRLKFGGANALTWPSDGSLDNPVLISTDDTAIPGGWAPGASMLVRLTVGTGQWCYSTKSIAAEIGWPSNNQRAAGDYTSNDTVLATNPTWSGSTYAPTWYSLRVKRATAAPMILVHGDSVATQVRAVAATNTTSGYGWVMRTNELTDAYHIVSMGHGGTSMATSEARTPELLAKHGDKITHMMIQSWSGNGSPVNVADCERIKANIIAMETAILAAGKKVLCVTLKPHGGTISTADEIAAYWHMVAWATTRYGVRHINLSQAATLSADGGITLLNSEDNVHFNATGQLAQATALKPLLDAALSADGYTV